MKENYSIILLKSRKTLKRNMDYLQKWAQRCALCTHNVGGYKSVFTQIEGIGEVLEMRDSVAYLLQAISEAMKSLPVVSNQIITAIYLAKISRDDVAKALKISSRTLSRWLPRALRQYEVALINLGITEQWLNEFIKPVIAMHLV